MFDGPSADTVLDRAVACPGDVVTGRVRLRGCGRDVVIDRVVVGVSVRGHFWSERHDRVLEYITASRHRRVFRPGIDAATQVRATHEDAARTDWASWLNGWLTSVAR